MLTDEQRKSLDSLSKLFLARFETAFAGERFEIEQTDHLEVTIPARHSAVGALCVELANEEVTVWFGEHYHRHYSPRDYGSATAEAAERAVEGALKFIRGILRDDVILEITYEGTTPRRASLRKEGLHEPVGRMGWFRDSSDGTGESRTVSYVWSGPLGRG
ncbi:MAG: hypothetical protein R3195_05600 [Gemmatimonadota bacterium]|nr:hypothetical protein [Gemmatimonadota bacterium]